MPNFPPRLVLSKHMQVGSGPCTNAPLTMFNSQSVLGVEGKDRGLVAESSRGASVRHGRIQGTASLLGVESIVHRGACLGLRSCERTAAVHGWKKEQVILGQARTTVE